MKQIKAIVEKSKDAFWAYAENLEGVSGVGATPQAAKASLLESIKLQQELGNIKNMEYIVVYQYDVESLLNYYKGIFTNAALEKITGIKQRQLQHYSSGLKKPRPEKRKKIESALHRLGAELMAVEL